MFGKTRSENQRLSTLAASRGEQLTDARAHIETLNRNQARFAQRQAALIHIIAAQIHQPVSGDALRKQLADGGFAAEITLALHQIKQAGPGVTQ